MDFVSWNMNHIRQHRWPNEDSELDALRYFIFFVYTNISQRIEFDRLIGFVTFSVIRQVWGCDIIVDWADPQEEPDESTMSKVKVLYVRNLTQDISEEKLKESFEHYGKVERVKKIKDYAFVHFEDRDNAVLAMRGLDGKELGCSNIEVCAFFIAFFFCFSLDGKYNKKI